VAALCAVALPVFGRAADAADAAGAARYLAARFAAARFDAARQQRTVAVRFSRTLPVSFMTIVDGNGDGVSAADVAAGIDRVMRPADRIEDHFPRARIGIAGPVPAIEASGMLTSSDDAVRFGVADQLSLSPAGTSSSGTVYITSRTGGQYAVRVSGVTGRARVVRYDGRGAWRSY
jgi:type II secretory pathway pseudopilin PulG